MSYDIKVSKQGRDALTSTDPNDLIFWGSYNTFKILEQGTSSFNVGTYSEDPGTTCLISHSQGTPKPFLIFFQFPDGYVQMGGYDGNYDFTNGGVGTTVNFLTRFVEINNNNISFYAYSAGTYTVKTQHFIFEAPL